MKKLALAILMALTITSFTNGQKILSLVPKESNKETKEFQKDGIQFSAVEGKQTKNMAPKALHEFSQSCKIAENVSWERDLEGNMAASYKMDGKIGRRFYNRKGNLICNILAYGEASLPNDIRKLVKSTYYMDYKILSAQEIESGGNKFYYVFIENKTNCKKLRITDDEMEVVQEFFN